MTELFKTFEKSEILKNFDHETKVRIIEITILEAVTAYKDFSKKNPLP